MGNVQGRALYLPRHLYVAYPFTDGRVVANLGPTSFRRQGISGDNVQVGSVETQSTSPRSAYVARLLAEGHHLRGFGALVAPLGVKYVVLTKAVDWETYRCSTRSSGDTLALMPTTRPRYLVTETDDLAEALNAAASRWPSLSRPQLLVKLALEGHRAAEQVNDDRRRRRLEALHRHGGMLTGTYGPGYLQRLHEEWPA